MATSTSSTAPTAAGGPPKPKSFERRDRLRELERRAQAEWAASRAFEEDAPMEGTARKFMVTFPYPYMNGRLHLGHAFTVSKAEFAAAYHRCRGDAALFPFAFHCTGMPIQAAANKLRRELEAAATASVAAPVDAAAEEEEVAEEAPAAAAAATSAASGSADKVPGKFTGKKTKAVAKSGGPGLTQAAILEKSGLAKEDIPAFQDPKHWLSYFPPLGKVDLQSLGVQVDWRRSFITTDANPFYDAFIRWQFNTLRKRDKLGFGKRPTIYSALDGQACADHDRASGEGVNPTEYTLIKLRVVEIPAAHRAAAALAPLADIIASGKNLFFVAATLRPETMYGQTNCYLLPDGDYGAFVTSSNDIFLCSERSARNMAYQGLALEYGKTQCVGTFKGADLMGLPLAAPYAVYPVVYTLPLMTISMAKGTGVVTSVPSDAPDDWAALRDLKTKAPLREKFGITDDMVAKDVVEIIDIPGYGRQAAVTVCDELKIKSQNDKDKLALAKDKVYLEGFYKGIMLVGKYAGRKVCDAKPLVRADMMAEGLAAQYWEPESLVVSRSGDECVVAELDQWYLKYGEEEWRTAVEAWVKSGEFKTYNPQTQRAFEFTLSWLKEWACSRNFGLGTHVPWDAQFMIESLSDSTIYMAYYTIAHLLQGGGIAPDVATPGPAGITPAQLSDAVFDYIFLGAPFPADCGIPEEVLARMRREFEFWYPMDLRVSGKDLIQNHLTMALYNHAAVWAASPPATRMPQGFFCNGHVQVDNEKMSKQAGNFITLATGVAEYGADALRLALADAGDGLDDANFSRKKADDSILDLTTELETAKEVLEAARAGSLRSGDFTFHDRVFDAHINRAIEVTGAAYDAMRFKEALVAVYKLQDGRDKYRDACAKLGTPQHAALAQRFVEVHFTLLAPICPHLGEHVWKDLLHKPGSVTKGSWPAAAPVDEAVLQQDLYLQTHLHEFYVAIQRQFVGKARGGKLAKAEKWASNITIYVSTAYPAWQVKVLAKLREMFDPAHVTAENPAPFPADVRKIISAAAASDADMASVKAQRVVDVVVQVALAHVGRSTPLPMLDGRLPFDEVQLWKDNMEYTKLRLNVPSVEVRTIQEGADVLATDTTGKAKDVTPGAACICARE